MSNPLAHMMNPSWPEPGWDAGYDVLQRAAFLYRLSDSLGRQTVDAVRAARDAGYSWRELDGLLGLPRGGARDLFEP
jgi:hypothetical protein